MKKLPIFFVFGLFLLVFSQCSTTSNEEVNPSTNNTNKDTTTVNVSFSKSVQPILNNNCISCHKGSTANSGVELDNYARLKATIGNIDRLGWVMDGSNGVSQMPLSGSLPSNDQRIIKTWILEGAKDN